MCLLAGSLPDDVLAERDLNHYVVQVDRPQVERQVVALLQGLGL